MGWQGSLLGCQMQSWSTVTRQQETTLQGTDAPTLVGGCRQGLGAAADTRSGTHQRPGRRVMVSGQLGLG